MNKINYYSIYEKEYQFEDDCEFLTKELSSGNTLEIGCGTGRILSYLKKIIFYNNYTTIIFDFKE